MDISYISYQDIDDSGGPPPAEPVPGDAESSPQPLMEQESCKQPIPTITFQLESGERFTAVSGDIIGRDSVGADLLQSYGKVSRNHLHLTFCDGRWWGKCLSQNGVWHDDQFIGQGEHLEICSGYELRLSSQCSVRVFI
jgi:hypothetical protein